MSSLLLYALLFIVNSYIATAAETLKIFIDEVPDYALLSTCAEAQLSTIVRDMAYGCGDDSLTTSYICFCYLSSASVTSQIRKHVESACSEQPAQNASMALSVFDSYCHIGHLEQPSSSTNLAGQL
ncbi:hypothetical protein BU24DRAFT_220095 [Aaosphaeria arxii CBS 175.79]|uniref:Extracellular membrane protein CFEM domain-containing protein n=1 Tax=Aaosphaeria arxii CBS 175.79 TaxID=1450172 RepID=A0A6A5XP45_9PLEO|nr:uncharacterized protein BU24DRAFT_220095 [Aaosphaeria arxii CBS 175.79]KAF2014713.1 hypothetical protein BU24DRAFT_220095 [Aaosphaeria arxii CBS 175.79]